jgi:excisionase family DNA binding protein
MEMSTDDRILLNVREAAHVLGVKPRGVYRLVEKRLIPSVRLGTRRIAIPRRELEEWASDQAAASLAQEEPPRLGKVG